jgi:hypothetical protein
VPGRSTFTITIQAKLGASWPVVVAVAQDNQLSAKVDGTFAPELGELLEESDPRAYGTRLGQALFRGGVRDAFIRALAGGSGPLHVLLTLEAADLRGLQWENLCGPIEGVDGFLGLDQRIAYSRFLTSAVSRRLRPLRRADLRALIVVASPVDLDAFGLQPFDAAAAVAAATATLGMPYDVLGDVPGAKGPASIDAICEHLTRAHYPILHVVAHGRHSVERGESALFLSDSAGQVDMCMQTRLSERLQLLADGVPHLAFFASCESASEPLQASAASLARLLVAEAAIPAVVAMSRRVSIATAHAFTTAFYARLHRHGHVDQAVVEATAGLHSRADILVPALYGRLGARPLFTIEADAPVAVPTAPTTVSDVEPEPAPEDPDPLADILGAVVGRYRVLRRLGSATGTVFAAEHVEHGQQRALKFMREELRARPDGVQRFMQEARVLQMMNHPHIVSVIESGQHNGSAFYVMEMLVGEDLRTRWWREGPFTWPRVRAIALQICDALAAMHAKGIVHRDLKPSNCFCVTDPGHRDFIKLLDFGVARLPRLTGGASSLTRSGALLGTIEYMAPEQISGHSSASGDVYALGVMLYEMLTGRLPFSGTGYAIVAAVLTTTPSSPRLLRSDIAPEVEALVLRAIAKDPAFRFSTIQEFADAIAAIAPQDPSSTSTGRRQRAP